MYWRVIVQGAVIHDVSPHTEGDRLAVGLLYGHHRLLLTVLARLTRLSSRAAPTAQTGPELNTELNCWQGGVGSSQISLSEPNS